MPCKNQVYDKEEQACNRVKLQNMLPTRRTAAALLMQEYTGCALVLRAEGFTCCRGATEPPLPSAGTHLAALGHVSPELMQDHSRLR